MLDLSRASRRALREKRTVAVMVRMYCRAKHGTKKHLCEHCRRLVEYANKRVDKCPFIERKPTCAKCTVHCFEKSKREEIRHVMRHSGPRMLLRHPLLAIFHAADGRRKAAPAAHRSHSR